MPQNPLDFLKAQTLKNVPASQPGQREMWDAEAAAKQANDPLWKRAGRNAIDALTSVFDDPFAEGAANASPGAKIGMMAAALPAMPKKLPIISPEAYSDVKAGGLRLYSRLTDAFGKAPKVMNPDKIRSVAAQGASKEEISYRKLEDLLKGRQPMDKIAREDVMAHLAANPIELDVVRKNAKPIPQGPDPYQGPYEQAVAIRDENRQLLRQFRHELDTRYGQGWNPDALDSDDLEEYSRIVTEGDRLDENVREAQDMLGYSDPEMPGGITAVYGDMQTPGPAKNYSEVLINLPPHGTNKAELLEQFRRRYGRDPHDIGTTTGDNPYANELDIFARSHADEHGFQSTHWDEMNNLVFTRGNERHMPTRPEDLNKVFDVDSAQMSTYVEDDGSVQPWLGGGVGNDRLPEWVFSRRDGSGGTSAFGNTKEDALRSLGEYESQYGTAAGPKGHLVEELQSDWFQQGREHGYRGDPLPPHKIYDANNTIDGPIGSDRWGVESDFFPARYSSFAPSPEEALETFRRGVEHKRVPDAPFKDTYHELGLKQRLLDFANDPDAEWFGINDALTVSSMEGHPNVSVGTSLNYDDKHPTALHKLLSPFGAEVGHEYIPNANPNFIGVHPPLSDIGYSSGGYKEGGKVPHGANRIVDFNADLSKGSPQIATALPGADPYKVAKDVQQARYPKNANEPKGAGMWSTWASPEMKKAIAERGFPAMMALMALQKANVFGGDEQ